MTRYPRGFDKRVFPRREDEHRINWNIRVPQVRVVREDEQLGIMPTDQARKLAQDEGLDLVEINPNTRPPVCKIMDYGQFKYEQQIKKKESSRKQRESQIQLKELRLRPGIAEHDAQTKMNQAKKFLEEGNRVMLNMQFRGHREMSHRDQGLVLMKKLVEGFSSFVVEKAPSIEGNRITCCIAPKS